jgi:SNF2 family DNA or RNA helicase
VVTFVPDDTARPVHDATMPALKVELKRYQREAIERLQRLYAEGSPGALLCDDMGLGKTLQTLVFASWVREQLRAGRSPSDRRKGEVDVPVCVVGPPSLLEGWLKELGARLGDASLPKVLWGGSEPPSSSPRPITQLKRLIRDGSGRGTTLEAARIDLEALRADAPDILFIPYDTLRRLQFAVGTLRFGLIIADEAQEAKDPSSLRSLALRAMNADFRLALTGTPVENRWLDLWTIADFAVPGHLGAQKDFTRAFRPTDDDVLGLGQRLAERMDPVLIRRTRADALGDLPPCAVVVDERPMPDRQRFVYDAERSRRDTRGVLGLIQRLGAISLHPRQQVVLDSAEAADAWAMESARTQALWDALRQSRDDERATLVFVRSIAMQHTLQRALQCSFQLPNVPILNGSVAQPERHRMVDSLRNDTGFRVLLISPDVGGAGWNLQFAARAVLLERPFNPAVEAQMVARIHRLGQKQPVEVTLPIATHPSGGSYDQILAQLLTEKELLASSVLAPQASVDGELQRYFERL